MLAVSEVPPILTNSVTTIHFRDMDYEDEASISDRLVRLSTTLGDSALMLHFLSCYTTALSVNSTHSFANGEPLLGGLLLGDSHGGLVSSCNVVRSLGNMELDVAV